MSKALLLFILTIFAFSLMLIENNLVIYVLAKQNEDNIGKQPIIKDTNLRIELVSRLKAPTSIAFLDNKDILVLELYNGTVRRIVNDTLQYEPLLDVNVARVIGERGMLGITTSKSIHGSTYVFLYYTESESDNGEPIGNRLYRYELVNNKLVNPKLLLDLPVEPGPYHNGGSMAISRDNNIYLTIGDLDNVDDKQDPNTKAQNLREGDEPNGSGGILRVTQSGRVVGDGIIGNTYPLNLYYAYGIRNSFGIDFDPLTGNLWDTENGPNFGDEINLVKPGFNSGWLKVQGIWQKQYGKHYGDIGAVAPNPPHDLVDFNGEGKYSSPEFTWKNRTGPTALKFLDSSKLGKDYENDLLVGNMHNGSIYHFELNKERNGLLLNGLLQDRIADDNKELQEKIFAQGFDGGITDIDVGPDGYLYVVSGIWSNDGKIYRIIPKGN